MTRRASRRFESGPRYHLRRTVPKGPSVSFCLPITLPVHRFGDSEGQTNPSSPFRDEIRRRLGGVNDGLGFLTLRGARLPEGSEASLTKPAQLSESL